LEFLAPYDRINLSSSPLNARIIQTFKKKDLPENIRPINKPIPPAEYYYGLSQVNLMGNNIQEAYLYINEALKRDAQDSRFFLVRGRVFAKDKKLMPALADFEHSLKLDPNNNETYLELAFIYEAQGRWQEAQNYYQKAIELAPNNHRQLFSYAYFTFNQGQLEQALSLALKLTSSSEVNTFSVWELIGDIYSRASKFDLARDAYEKSYQQNSTNYMIRIKLGELDLMKGEIKEALRKFESSRDMLEFYQPNDIKLYFLLADCYLRLDQFGKAANIYRWILRKDPGNYEVYKKLQSLK
jgi:tetratricopeptide (TPR) repeat protein